MRQPFVRTVTRAARRLAAPALAFAVLTCATNPVTGRRELSLISEDQEIQMGQQAAQEAAQAMGVVQNQALQSYVSTLGTALARGSERPNLPWSFTVVDDPNVNAFALPGGPVFVTRGILTHMNSEAQLVSVLGHEIGHITAKHSVRQLSRAQLAQIGLIGAMIVKPELAQFGDLASSGLGLLFLKYGRDDETQADDLGFRYMVAARYDPREMAEMFRTLQRLGAGGEGKVPEWLSTHPDPGNRVQQTMSRIQAAGTLPPGLQVDRDEFLQRVNGLVFGADPRQGFFRGTTFMHPDLRFRIDFPNGWQTQNMAQAVVGGSPQQDAIVTLALAGTTAPSAALQQFVGQQGIQSGGASTSSINGLQAAHANFAAQTEQGVLEGVVAFVSLDSRTYRLLGYAPQQRASAYANTFRQAIGSFQRLTDPAALGVKPNVVRLVRLSQSMTLEQFNAQNPSVIPIAQLALINGVEASTVLPAGTTVKRVVVE
jgi:predicted Zn-dependent protease